MTDDKKTPSRHRPLDGARAVLEGRTVPTVHGRPETPVPEPAADAPTETGGPTGPEPTRYGDWERKGRCIDF